MNSSITTFIATALVLFTLGQAIIAKGAEVQGVVGTARPGLVTDRG
jgi:hypothetical protein